MDAGTCPFCARIATGDFVAGSDLAVAFPDADPVGPGHTLVCARRHEPDFFALTADEQAAMLHLANAIRGRLLLQLSPDGFTLGVNGGAAAGQTVPHAHLHVIPRFTGDVADPRGGVRRLLRPGPPRGRR